MSMKFSRSAVPSSIKLWENLPVDLKGRYSRNSFKYNLKRHVGGKPNNLVTTKLNISRPLEVILNRVRCDFIFKAHLFSHNFVGIRDSQCSCGHRSQDTKHIFFKCPLLVNLRNNLFDALHAIPNFIDLYSTLQNLDVKLTTLLHGNDALSLRDNIRVLENVSLFIKESILKVKPTGI